MNATQPYRAKNTPRAQWKEKRYISLTELAVLFLFDPPENGEKANGPSALPQQLSKKACHRLECRIDLGLIFAACFGDLGLAAAGAAHLLGYRAH